MAHYSQRMAYGSSYEPVFSGGRRPTYQSTTPDFSSLPAGRSVIIKRDRKTYPTALAQNQAMKDWFEQMDITAREIGEARVGDKTVVVAIFKSTKKAAIFKLAWG